MLSQEILANHYAEYAAQSDEWVSNMEKTKHSIVRHVLNAAGFHSDKDKLNVAVLGASDKRYIPIHERVFAESTKKEIALITFDLDPKHLGGASTNVILHDVTQPFPGELFDIVFSHELMKFLGPEEQLKTIVNSYQALCQGGVAMHIIHEPSIQGTQELRSWQHRVDPDTLLRQLKERQIPVQKLVFESESNVEWLRKTTVLLLSRN